MLIFDQYKNKVDKIINNGKKFFGRIFLLYSIYPNPPRNNNNPKIGIAYIIERLSKVPNPKLNKLSKL